MAQFSLLSCFVLEILFHLSAAYKNHTGHAGLTVQTTSGTVIGITNATYPGVRRFLSIPYAAPPVGDLRWEPPQRYESKGVVHANSYGPACPQFNGIQNSFYNYASGFGVTPALLGEDCLTVSVYAPDISKGGCGSTGLPVFIWLYGGGFIAGGADTPYEYPDRWIQRTNGLIFIEINFRENIFGFPGAAGITEQNLSQMDQRMGIEWARDNIAAFGGDPERMVLIGQSAGAAATDLQMFTNIDDPIVKGSISHSGNALGAAGSRYANNTSQFTFIASHLNCGNLSATDEIACMRKVSWQDIEGFLSTWANDSSTPAISFGPIIDEQIIFSNYTERIEIGAVARIPRMLGYCYRDSLAMYPFADINPQTGPTDISLFYSLQDGNTVCSAALETVLRAQNNFTTYRFVYAGNFSNISPLPWEGAFHASDIPILFGNHQDWLHGPPSTPYEYATSHAMQDFWLAFANDTSNGLMSAGWAPIDSSLNGDVLLFGANGSTVTYQSFDSLEGFCASD